MSLEVFTGNSVPALLQLARERLGADACVIQVRRRDRGYELIASDKQMPAPGITEAKTRVVPVPVAAPDFGAVPASAPDFGSVLRQESRRSTPRTFMLESGRGHRDAPAETVAAVRHPRIVALVGPTGAGKTTTIAKLATNPEAFGGKNVGLLGLDTYRVGAVEQLQTYAELAGVPCEVVYADADLRRALDRLGDCDVILVDTPGRGPRQIEDSRTLRRWLERIQPDEVHLVLPAGRMPQVTRGTIDLFLGLGVTHAIATKLDEAPPEDRLFDVCAERGIAMRWLTDGQDVPADLHPAAEELGAAKVRLLNRRHGGAAA